MDWYPGARRLLSPHKDARPDGVTPDLLVLHNISLPPNQPGAEAISDFFLGQLDTGSHPWFARLHGVRVSAHFLVCRDGEIRQFVPLQERAWHAGKSTFLGRENLNDNSIGIELEGADHMPFSAAQYQALAMLCRWLLAELALPADRITGHETIAPMRKTDPGAGFDWLTFYHTLESSS
ncbi:1,6-anhydro-N-acetylmuramyl-L-alanine amidase AmpD [Gallaecimonas sp. GXIMD1310]|uniref:1,6-anhydro-N-acetylmuramyl-L-alanine amidase AmpD n=1 Tax=Gallaecimonas sp. GXIMD1310 TaxID=3131926 RepID=UPI0032473FDE